MRTDNLSHQLISAPRQINILSFLLIYRWASLVFAVFLLLGQKTVPWSIIITAIAFNIGATIYLKIRAKDDHGNISFVFLDLIACVFLFVKSGYAVVGQAFNPFFIYSFTPLLGVTFKYQSKGGLVAATILSLAYLFVLVNGPSWVY